MTNWIQTRAMKSAGWALVLAVAVVLHGGAQNGPSAPAGVPRQAGGFGHFGDADPAIDPVIEEQRLRALNKERHKSMVSDAARLLKLANQLDAELKGQGPDKLSPRELDELAQIEKLAHNVREKMSYSVQKSPVYEDQTHYGPK